jgi:hypothetical protein
MKKVRIVCDRAVDVGEGGLETQACVRGNERTGLHKEGPHRLLEGGDRAGDVGEGGLEMGKHLRGGLARRFRPRPGRRLRGRTALTQGGSDLALSLVEPFPDALPGPLTQPAIEVAAGGEYAAGDGALEEPPQSAGGQAKPSDFVGEPNAESPPTTGTRMAVAAKDPSSAQRLSSRAAVVKPVQAAVPNQRAHDLAMRTGSLLQPLRKRRPFVVIAKKPAFLAHEQMPTPKIVILPAAGRGGVVARYDQDP